MPSRSRTVAPLLFILLAVVLIPRLAAAQAFNVVDLGALCRNAVECDTLETTALGLNSFGDVAGASATDPSDQAAKRAFLWTHGPRADLGRLPGMDVMLATGVNNGRRVVGYGSTRTSTAAVPFVWTDGTGPTALATLGGKAYAFDINNGDVIVGSARPTSGGENGVVWRDGAIVRDLGPGVAMSINDRGEIAGWVDRVETSIKAAMWDASGGEHLLGTLGGSESSANGISSEGRVVGVSQIAGNATSHAFVWEASTGMRDIGTLGGSHSAATAVEGRWVVGLSGSTAGSFDQHAFLYDLTRGEMIDLNDTIPPDFGWVLLTATEVNESGQIVAIGGRAGQFRAFLLTPWRSSDIGDVGTSGDLSFAGGEFTVSGAGADIWGTEDAFHFVYQDLWGDAEIVARVTSLQDTHEFAKAGVMMRDALHPTAATVILDVRPNGELELMRRDATGGEMVFLAGGTQPPPTWLKLRRMGTVVTGYVSADGDSWHVVGYATLPFRSRTYAGLAVTSHDTGVTNTATFDHVAAAPTWTSHDIGFTSAAEPPANGALYSVSNDHFVVHATGADIWGSADELHFVHAPVRGTGSIGARVAVLTAQDDFAKAGVMLRASLAPDAATVIFDVRPNGELEFMVRPATGEDMSFIAGGTRSVPIWLELQRQGSQVIAQTSPNGVTWTLLATVDVALPDVVYAGLAVTSRDPGSAATALVEGLTGWWTGVP